MLYNLMNTNLPANVKSYIDFNNMKQIINAIEKSWISGQNQISIPFWSDEIGVKAMSRLTYGLSESRWISSSVNGRFGSISLNIMTLSKYMSIEHQREFRRKNRVRKYLLSSTESTESSSTLVNTISGVRETGLDRPGFAKCAKQGFSFDTSYIIKYYDAIQTNLVKSMKKMAEKYPHIKNDKTNYGEICSDILDLHIFEGDKIYNMGFNLSDTRGRSIYDGLKKVFNPVANKDARALLIADKSVFILETDTKMIHEIYRFIAELAGNNASSYNGKVLSGKMSYATKKLETLDLSKAKHRKKLHNNIWLERIYNALDSLFEDGYINWSIPLEKDATASIAQIIGVLMNDKRLLAKTNVIEDEDIQDFWEIDGVSNRNGIKAIGTPVGYGSSKSFRNLLAAKNETLSPAELKAVEIEFSKGAFGVIRGFKDFILQHSNIESPTVELTTWRDTFTVDVNKFKTVSATISAYTAYDSETSKMKTFMIHNPIKIPDYNRFKLFLPTGLIHNLDSAIMDSVMDKITYQNKWAISIHDAGLVLPGSNMEEYYVEEIEQLRNDRHQVLDSYRKSIGAVGRASDIAFAKLMSQTEQLEDTVEFCKSALK